MPNLDKNAKIREKRKQTLIRRKSQRARTFELKLVKNKISKTKLAVLNRLFLEAKWFTNYIIGNGIFNFKSHVDYKVKKVQVKVGNTFQEREIQVLSSQMKQALIERLQDNVIALSKLKKKGLKVGRIRFVKAVHSIPLKQYGSTHWVKKKDEMVHIQGVGNFRVSGVDQIPENAEFSTANFVERNGDYYLLVTCFLPKENKHENEKAIGIDLGVKNQLTFSNGVKLQYSVPVNQRLRRLYHFFSRAKPESRNREKLLLKIKREFEKQNNRKKDIINKVTHFVTTNYSQVVFQNDNIRSWQRLYGKKIYETSIGGIRNALKRKASTPVGVGRFVRTTGVCPACRTHIKLDLSQREFTCPSCNSTFDRDVASAIVILKEGLSLWNVGETPGDENVSAMAEYLSRIPHVSVSMNWEAPSIRVG